MIMKHINFSAISTINFLIHFERTSKDIDEKEEGGGIRALWTHFFYFPLLC